LKATMPRMVQEIREAYAEAIGKPAKPAKTPGYPGKCLKRPWKLKNKLETYRGRRR